MKLNAEVGCCCALAFCIFTESYQVYQAYLIT